MNNSISCDLLVAGAGVAGVTAAVAAARAGARVVLVESQPVAGGAGVRALHRFICGLYLNTPQQPREALNGGLVNEILHGLGKLAPSYRPVQQGRVWVHPFEPAHFQAVYETLARESNLFIRRSTVVEAVQSEGNCIRSVDVRSPDGLSSIKPLAVIDATGSGDLIRLSGAPFCLAPVFQRQLSGCTVHLTGIAPGTHLLGIKIQWALSRIPADQLKGLPTFAGFVPGPGKGEGFCKWSLGAEATAREEEGIHQLHGLLKELLPELAGSRILAHSPAMAREGLRLVGELELEEEAILQATKYPDGVVRNAWPIEFWKSGQAGPEYLYPPEGDYYEIPRRCLRSQRISNLFATGRCISATSRALASARVMGSCMALGEAAGRYAISTIQHQQ